MQTRSVWPGIYCRYRPRKEDKVSAHAVDTSVICAIEHTRVQHRIPYIVQEENSDSYFVDYLNSTRWEFFNLEAYLEFLFKHGHALDPLIKKKFRSSSPEYEKLSWVVKYHNNVGRSLESWIHPQGYELEYFMKQM